MPRYIVAVLIVAALFVILWPARNEAHRPTIHVSAAMSLRDSLTEIAHAFEQKPSRFHIVLNFAGSNTLARQIIEGAPCDLFISADRENAERVASGVKNGRVTTRDLLRNQLVIVARLDDPLHITSPADLERPEVGRIAACDAAVPIGAYTREYLKKKNLEKLLADSPRFDDVAAACAAVANGQMRLGFAYRTDVEPDGKLRIVFTPAIEDQPAIVYSAVLIESPQHVSGNHPNTPQGQLLESLFSPESRAIFERHGFIIIAP